MTSGWLTCRIAVRASALRCRTPRWRRHRDRPVARQIVANVDPIAGRGQGRIARLRNRKQRTGLSTAPAVLGERRGMRLRQDDDVRLDVAGRQRPVGPVSRPDRAIARISGGEPRICPVSPISLLHIHGYLVSADINHAHGHAGLINTQSDRTLCAVEFDQTSSQ